MVPNENWSYYLPAGFETIQAQVVQAQDLLQNASNAYYVWGAVTIASWSIIALLFKLYKESIEKKQELVASVHESRVVEYQTRLKEKQILIAEKEKEIRDLRNAHEEQVKSLYEQMTSLMKSQNLELKNVMDMIMPFLEKKP